ncbi:hypothetical protein P3X46_019700 [Hevea brasiliensis]|uniref:CCHC-type domain-containing protein n=1 Tax=Hevea brasiliensis TaxID=3981 RepID=A0ABQ9LJJ2_HEVBR|nr:hypothetical protein P3X46_019700 [Hevea brasiliensis]
MDVYLTMKILDDLDFKSWMDWKIIMELVLERSNGLRLLMMRKKIYDGIYALVPETNQGDSAKKLEMSNKLQKMKYDIERSVSNHIMKISSFAYRLRAAWFSVSDPDIFVNVKTLCDDREEEWGLDELICRCEKAESVCHMLKSNRTVSGEREGIGNDQLGEKPNRRRHYKFYNSGRTGHLMKDCKQISSR